MTKDVTLRYLQNAAYAYLGRYPSSVANLAAVLERKTRRRNEGFAAPNAAQIEMIGQAVEKCVSLGLVSDEAYATSRTRSLHARGKSRKSIEFYLRQKGVGGEFIARAFDTLAEEQPGDLELEAALAYAKRRRFGPFRKSEADADKKRKELASLARAGFGYQLSSRIIEATSIEELEG